jgi:hypothetical protein
MGRSYRAALRDGVRVFDRFARGCVSSRLAVSLNRDTGNDSPEIKDRT